MSRHSRNNTASAVFTYHERKYLSEGGSLQERLGGDFLRQFEQCHLCLQVAENPVATARGVLFCRRCIVLNFGEQKKAWEKQRIKFSLRPKRDLVAEAEANKLQQFIAAQTILPSIEDTRLEEKASLYQPQIAAGDIIDDSDEERETVKMNLKRAIHDRKTKKWRRVTEAGPEAITTEFPTKDSVSFWAPHETPTGEEAIEVTEKSERNRKEPSEKYVSMCPVTNTALRLKDLIPVKPEVQIEERTGKVKWLCSVSLKELSHHKVLLNPTTGQLILEEVKRQVGVDEGELGKGKEFIVMLRGGTGFAAHNAVQAKVVKPAIA